MPLTGELLPNLAGIFPDLPDYEYVTILLLPPQPMPLSIAWGLLTAVMFMRSARKVQNHPAER